MNTETKTVPVNATLDAEMKAMVDAAPDSALYQIEEQPGDLSGQELLSSAASRRVFLQRMSAAGLGVAAIALLNGCDGGDDGGPNPNPNPTGNPTGSPTAGPTATPTGANPQNFPGIVGRDINEVVLNYALALEIFEADIYRQSLNVASGLPVGTPLRSAGSYSLAIAPGALAETGQSVSDTFTFLRNITFNETAHRDFLRTALRSMGAPIQAPNPGGYQFPNGEAPGSTLRDIMAKLLPIEENGPRAYLGAAGFLTTLTLIQTAGTIYSIEARQSALIADVLGRTPGPVRMEFDQQVTDNYPSEDTFEYFRTPVIVLRNVLPPYLRTSTTTA